MLEDYSQLNGPRLVKGSMGGGGKMGGQFT